MYLKKRLNMVDSPDRPAASGQRGNGAVSKLELVAAMQNSSRAASYLFPSVNTRRMVSLWQMAKKHGTDMLYFFSKVCFNPTLGWW